ncbi:hypothetical protein NIES4075_62720 [Tolypothrix sp. NIES-4075]|nr:hypothetical protein NIES4075_62720 [Tolypothrix sp. NIES-4075]
MSEIRILAEGVSSNEMFILNLLIRSFHSNYAKSSIKGSKYN